MYLTKTFLIYVIYIVLYVSVHTKILHVETIMLENYALTKFYLVKYLTKSCLKYEHVCSLVCMGTNLKCKENF